MRPINWHWLEDLLVRACELEVQAMQASPPAEPVFAFCLEFDGVDGTLGCSYGTRAPVDAAFRRQRRKAGGGPVYYRAVELRPEHWELRRLPVRAPDGWERARPLLDDYRAAMDADPEPEAAEFLWLRFEYLAESVVRRAAERDAFRGLAREPQFLAFAANPDERMEEVEDRIARLYPAYRPATVEMASQARPGELPAENCEGEGCGQPHTHTALSLGQAESIEMLRRSLAQLDRQRREKGLLRCTACQRWYCPACGAEHVHEELLQRRPFFAAS